MLKSLPVCFAHTMNPIWPLRKHKMFCNKSKDKQALLMRHIPTWNKTGGGMSHDRLLKEVYKPGGQYSGFRAV